MFQRGPDYGVKLLVRDKATGQLNNKDGRVLHWASTSLSESALGEQTRKANFRQPSPQQHETHGSP